MKEREELLRVGKYNLNCNDFKIRYAIGDGL